MQVIITIFDREYLYLHWLGSTKLKFNTNELFIDKENIINEFKKDNCKVNLDIGCATQINEKVYYIEIVLIKWSKNKTYGGLYRLGKDIFINAIGDIIKKNIILK